MFSIKRLNDRRRGKKSGRRWAFAFFIMVGFALLGGCSANQPPAEFIEGVNWMTDARGVRDAKTQRVKDWPCLRIDAALADRLDAITEEQDLERARQSAHAFLDDAHRLALSSSANELARLDDDGWRELTTRYFAVSIEPSDDVKTTIRDEFRHRTDVQIWFLKQRINSAEDVASIRQVFSPIREKVEESVKTTRYEGAPLLALLAPPAALARSAVHAKESGCQINGPFEAVVSYEPQSAPKPNDPADAAHWNLLSRYAPAFVQELPKSISYNRSADEIGRVVAPDTATIEIDTHQPAVYGYTRTILIQGQPHIQLIYAIWYPEHPALSGALDPVAGRIDGATVRITLDANQRPAVFETLNNCGCHHRAYPTDALEAAARHEIGEPLEGKRFAIERQLAGKYDIIVPKTIAAGDAKRVFVRSRAGTHAIVDVDMSKEENKDEPLVQRRSYQLLPYSELEHLTTDDGRVVSMFLPNGLVRGAERLEGDLFKPLGMLNAGQPRQRGTQLIQWDQFDFDDPHLLERTMRLPKTF